jgi:hypothetical protein
MEGAYIGVPLDQLPHVARRVLVELFVAAKYENSDVNRAKH